MWRLVACTLLAQVSGHDDDMPDHWYEAYKSARERMEKRYGRRLGLRPLPAKLPDKGDPEEVHVFVLGDWGTYPGTGINMESKWDKETWNQLCFQGSSSPEEWKAAKAALGYDGKKVQDSWGGGRPICGSMHIECSWGGRDGRSKRDRCNPDHDSYWRDHFAQQNVAGTMTDLGRKRKPSFVVNTADAFYFAGVDTTTDDLWRIMFEELYTDESLQVPWLGSLGNHDYGGHDCDWCLFKAKGFDSRRSKPCSQAQIDYDTEHDWQWPNDKEVRWVLPMKGNDRWYMKSFVFKKANVSLDVFVIDTNKAHVSSQCGRTCPDKGECIGWFMNLWERQKLWLLPALEKSKADWKWVVGHAPPENFEESLMDQMHERGVSVYMAGHVHQLRHDKHPSGIEVIISGSGGGYQSAGGGTSYTVHETQAYGFATINVKWNELSIEYWDDQGARLWEPIVVPKGNMMQATALKKLRQAALNSDAEAMKDYIAKAKDQGADEDLIWAAALQGVKNFEADGGMVWVYMQPKLVRLRPDETRATGILASWATEDSLPTSASVLSMPEKCCGQGAEAKDLAGKSVLCYASRESCSGQMMAATLKAQGASVLLLVSTEQIVAENASEAEALELPAVSIPESFVQHVRAWLGNEAEVISMSYTGGEKGYEDAVEQARKAGVPEDRLRAAQMAAQRLRAQEHVKTALKSSDPTLLRKALDMANECGAEGDIIDQAKEKLGFLEVQEEVRKAGKECQDFDAVHDLIVKAEALAVEDLGPAVGCRLRLALEALELAQRAGAACKEPMERAIAWCKLANALDAPVQKAASLCDEQVQRAFRMNALLVFVLLLIGIGVVVGMIWRARKPQAAPARSNQGIELLEAS